MQSSSRECRGRRRTIETRQHAVERAEAYLRSHGDGPVPIATLSRVVGLSERALRNAFYTVRGMSPKRCIVAERLQGVRHALTSDWSRPSSVTSVATRYGFYELGRFANTYKKAFGETPSETLRGAARESVNSKGHGHAATP
jgi:transcriptional regulator GlxA family with amidase domain